MLTAVHALLSSALRRRAPHASPELREIARDLALGLDVDTGRIVDALQRSGATMPDLRRLADRYAADIAPGIRPGPSL